MERLKYEKPPIFRFKDQYWMFLIAHSSHYKQKRPI